MINYLSFHFLGLASCAIRTSVSIDLDSPLKSNVNKVTYGH
jgi:hypothetical protein